MTEEEKAIELALYFCSPSDVVRPNIASVRAATKCCEQIIGLDCLTDEAWLNVPQEYKVQYWKSVINQLDRLI